MARFKFNILTGDNAQAKYDAITVKDEMTFYLLETGVGYFRGKKLFDQSSISTIDTINGNEPTDGIPTEKAIVEYIAEALRDKISYEIDGVPGAGCESGNGSSINSYSINEARIGTWIDGKPLYQRTFETNLPTAPFTGTKLIALPDDIKDVMEMQYLITDYAMGYTYYSFGNFTYGDSHLSVVDIERHDGELAIYGHVLDAVYSNAKFITTLRYTKTTD